MSRTDTCDVCGKHTTHLVDYFAMVCPDCKRYDVHILKLIGQLRTTVATQKARMMIMEERITQQNQQINELEKEHHD